ncbi:MAG: patatin-like phospholipase family protein [Anaerolineae bacterium]
MTTRWRDALPRPVAFALSGGANLGAIQVGMLKALAEVGLRPDIVVGASVGAINGAVIADRGLDEGARRLEQIWHNLSRGHIFPGNLLSQLRRLVTTRISLFRQDELAGLICRTLSVPQIEQFRLPFGALATELLTDHGVLFTAGRTRPALLASSAIPGVYPPVKIDGKLYVDGGLTAHVPLRPAVDMGAASIVVLDAGGNCHRQTPPRRMSNLVIHSMNAILRQRVLLEAPAVAAERPVLYLPTPCLVNQSILGFEHSAQLIEQSAALSRAFLAEAPLPRPGAMSGGPHFHKNPPPGAITFARA